MSGLVYTPLAIERRALRRAMDDIPVLRVGMGCRKAPPETSEPIVVAGVAGGLAPQVRPGDVVVADEVRRGGESIPIPSAPLLAGALRRLGLTVHCGPIVSTGRVVDGKARLGLALSGALAVDLESAAVVATGTGPIAVVRSIVDATRARLWSPGTLWRGIRALRSLRAAAPALRWWLAADGPREIALTAPHSFCAEVVLVIGSPATADSAWLMELARQQGASAYLIKDAAGIDLRWLAGVRRVGIAAVASAPPTLVDAVVHALSGLGPVRVPDVQLTPPREVV